jgi:hypothetical protein
MRSPIAVTARLLKNLEFVARARFSTVTAADPATRGQRRNASGFGGGRLAQSLAGRVSRVQLEQGFWRGHAPRIPISQLPLAVFGGLQGSFLLPCDIPSQIARVCDALVHTPKPSVPSPRASAWTDSKPDAQHSGSP